MHPSPSFKPNLRPCPTGTPAVIELLEGTFSCPRVPLPAPRSAPLHLCLQTEWAAFCFVTQVMVEQVWE